MSQSKPIEADDGHTIFGSSYVSITAQDDNAISCRLQSYQLSGKGYEQKDMFKEIVNIDGVLPDKAMYRISCMPASYGMELSEAVHVLSMLRVIQELLPEAPFTSVYPVNLKSDVSYAIDKMVSRIKEYVDLFEAGISK